MSAELAVSGPWSLPFSFRHVALAVRLTDAALIVLSSVATGCLYRGITSGTLGEVKAFAATGVLVAILVMGVTAIRGSSRPEQLLKPARQVKDIFLAWVFALLVVVSTAFAWQVSSDFSRGAVALFFMTGFSAMAAGRILWSRILHDALKKDRLKARRTAVLFSAEADRREIGRELENLRRHGMLPQWQIALPARTAWDQDAFQLPATLRGTNVEEVVILSKLENVPDLVDVDQLRQLPIPVRFLPLGDARLLCSRPREAIGDNVLIEWQRGSLSGAERAAKSAFDKIAAVMALLVLVPLFALVALLIKLESRGPVFFRQARRGFNGLPFQIWKFRTMHVAQDDVLVFQAVVGDPRVTRVGRWLRRASIDELPQLINVLRGEMSIVGPRPHALSHDDYYDQIISRYAQRQHVLPGLTGWAQIRGARGETPTVDHMRRRVELDLWYVQNWSFRQDIWILTCTVWHVLTARDAY